MTDEIGVLGINFDEKTLVSYAGVRVSIKDGEDFIVCVCNTGDPVRDFVSAWNWLVDAGVSHIFFSSTFDTFLWYAHDHYFLSAVDGLLVNLQDEAVAKMYAEEMAMIRAQYGYALSDDQIEYLKESRLKRDSNV